MQFFHHFASKLNNLASRVSIQPLQAGRVVYVNESLVQELELPDFFANKEQLYKALFHGDEQAMNDKNKQSCDGRYQLAGNVVAQKYGGHQFGQWNPALGDGRGVLLGEHQDNQGKLWDLHLKGAGPTPYSRQGDGRAVLRSTMREFLASEALHGLGIPTSRALCLVASDEPVQRERLEPGAMLIRVAQSHIRFGHFEYFHHAKQPEHLQALFDYCFEHHFPEWQDHPDRYYNLLLRIVTDTADMIALWQAHGFNHGVMNTDNMSIHGITFDYGPFAFLDDFQAGYICNRSDHYGRYAFDQQPGIGLWNLNALAHAFTGHLDIDAIKQALLHYEKQLHKSYRNVMAQKMGFTYVSSNQSAEQHIEYETEALLESDGELLNDWLAMLETQNRDYTLAFQQLTALVLNSDSNTNSNSNTDSVVSSSVHSSANSSANASVHTDQSERLPRVTETQFLDFFVDRVAASKWLARYKDRVVSQQISAVDRFTMMQQVNPRYVLRNHLAQAAIMKAYQNDYSEFEALLDAVSRPYQYQKQYERFAKPPEEDDKGIALSCSS